MLISFYGLGLIFSFPVVFLIKSYSYAYPTIHIIGWPVQFHAFTNTLPHINILVKHFSEESMETSGSKRKGKKKKKSRIAANMDVQTDPTTPK